MDPLTQGLVGTAASQLVSTRREKVAAAVLGFFSGMAADLDVLITSSTDPLLFLEYHRHFTHALIFIPFGALICAVAFWFMLRPWLAKRQLPFSRVYLFCLAGYSTHAVLDACTTYGTQLFWPFSSVRVAWNNVSVIDPLFTLPLLFLTGLAIYQRSSRTAVFGAVYAVAYLGLGVVQNRHASEVAMKLAEARGHQAINLDVKPSFANLVVWKSVYEHQGRYYVDAIRVAGKASIFPGTSTEKMDLAKHFPWLEPHSQQARDVERFRWFSNNHLGVDPDNPLRIIDVRYSLVPNRLDGMWGIVLSKKANDQEHVKWTTSRPQGDALDNSVSQLWRMLVDGPQNKN